MAQTEHHSHLRSKKELSEVLRRIGIAPETIAEIELTLPERFDIYDAGGLLQSYGLTLDEVISRLGGSP